MVILIADDDRLVRYSLKSMLLDIDRHIKIDEARNGRELVQKAQALQPDVAFVDINMPLLNGLSAIRECKKLDIPTQYVVLTAYAEFEYAQKGIQLQVADYLMKPVSPEELGRVVARLVAHSQEQRHSRLEKYQLEVIGKFTQWEKEKRPDQPLAKPGTHNGDYCIAAFFNGHITSGATSSTVMQMLLPELNALAEKLAGNAVQTAVLSPDTKAAYAVFHYSGRNLPDSILKAMTEMCACFTKADAFVSCAYTSVDSLNGAYQYYHWTSHNAVVRYLLPGNVPMVYPDIALPQVKDQLVLAAQADKLMEAFMQPDEVMLARGVQAVAAVLNGNSSADTLKNIAAHLSAISRIPICGETPAAFLRDIKKLARFMRPPDKLPLAGKIAKIQLYIDENYMHDISVSSLAKQFGLTPNYLSSLFHEKTGKRFIEYLTDVRMANAVKILKHDPNVPVNELARLIGYTSAPYFSNLFKKYTGHYPSQYPRENKQEGTHGVTNTHV